MYVNVMYCNVNDTIFLAEPYDRVMQLNLKCQLITTEIVTEHWLQPSINLHVPATALCSAALVPNVLPRRDEG